MKADAKEAILEDALECFKPKEVDIILRLAMAVACEALRSSMKFPDYDEETILNILREKYGEK